MSDTITAPLIAEFLSVAGGRPLPLTVLAPDKRDPSGMGTVARVVESAIDTSGPDTPGQWTLTFADDVPGNSSRLITSATRRFTLAD